MLGYFGLTLLVVVYLFLVTRWDKLFVPINLVASFILTIYAITLKDIPFSVVNSFVTILLFVKLIKKD